MSSEDSLDARLGRYESTAVGGEPVRAFIPPPLPPVPPLRLDSLFGLLEEANRALGQLDGVTSILPETPCFLDMYGRKEALLSSQIEGTQSSLSDLLLYENDEVPGVPLDDVQEVSSYVAAMAFGLERLRDGLPLSSRLIRDIHGVLLSGGHGSGMQPGEFRRSQNWVGGTRPGNAAYVPPPPNLVGDLMSDLERFIHAEPPRLPLLIRAALVHVQFESIHPFLDGNGRLGRLLITFLLCAEGALREPVLYLSLYLKRHRAEYYDHLQAIRDRGDWESWLAFFFDGVRETADQAAQAARDIIALFERDRARIEQLGRPAGSALRVHQYLQSKPLVTVPAAVAVLGLSAPTVRKSINHLADLGIVEEPMNRQRDRVYVYREYIALLSQGTEPL